MFKTSILKRLCNRPSRIKAMLFRKLNDATCALPFLHSLYDEKQRKIILDAINTSSEDDLTKFSLGKARSRGLCKTRQVAGVFKDLESAFEKLEIKDKAFKRFCDAILFDESVGGASKLRLSNVVVPNHSPELLKDVSSVVGLHIGTNVSIAWAQISRDFELQEWNLVSSLTNSTKKLNPCSLFKEVQDICQDLPEADVFVIENAPSILPQQAYMQLYIQRREVQATLLALLNTRLPHKDRVYFLRSRLYSRLYGIQIGSERVSSQPTVEKLLSGENVGPEQTSRLSVSHPELQAEFRAQSGPQREARSNALLLGMTFLKLAVHEDVACLKMLHLV